MSDWLIAAVVAVAAVLSALGAATGLSRGVTRRRQLREAPELLDKLHPGMRSRAGVHEAIDFAGSELAAPKLVHVAPARLGLLAMVVVVAAVAGVLVAPRASEPYRTIDEIAGLVLGVPALVHLVVYTRRVNVLRSRQVRAIYRGYRSGTFVLNPDQYRVRALVESGVRLARHRPDPRKMPSD